ncbi:unnamed protein product, partial [Mycena citricolor]
PICRGGAYDLIHSADLWRFKPGARTSAAPLSNNAWKRRYPSSRPQAQAVVRVFQDYRLRASSDKHHV